jgi:AraC-like DNA-binding protein
MILCFVKQSLPPELSGLKTPRLVYVSKMTRHESIHPRVMHRHPDFIEIILICKGQGQYSIDGRLVKVKAGDLIVYNSDIIHDEITGPESLLSWFCIAISNVNEPGLRPNAFVRDGIRPIFPAGDLFQPLQSLFELMFDQLANDRPGNAVTSYHLTQALLSLSWQVVHRGEPDANSDIEDEPLAQRVINYLDSHYTEEINLQDLAETFNVSTYYLAHVFKDCFGYSPMQYTLRRRIGEAQSLLISTDLSMTEIAARVGYDNPSHFNRQFSKYVGLPPRRYKMNYLHTPPSAPEE